MLNQKALTFYFLIRGRAAAESIQELLVYITTVFMLSHMWRINGHTIHLAIQFENYTKYERKPEGDNVDEAG